MAKQKNKRHLSFNRIGQFKGGKTYWDAFKCKHRRITRVLLRRLLLTRDIEVYEIKEKLLYDKARFYMIFLDYRRPSQYEDFSYIPGYEKEDFSGRNNYIQALILYNDKITDNEKDETYEIASGFLEDKDNCDWSMKYIQTDFDKLRAIRVNKEVLIERIGEIVASVGYINNISDINLDSFQYLYQS